MHKMLRRALPLFPGAAYAALTVLLSRLLIRHLGGIAGFIGGMTGLKESNAAYAAQVLSQLTRASVVSPLIPALLLGAPAGWLLGLLKKRRTLICVCLGALLLLPLTLLALWFTEVNGVQTGALLSALLPMLPHLL